MKIYCSFDYEGTHAVVEVGEVCPVCGKKAEIEEVEMTVEEFMTFLGAKFSMDLLYKQHPYKDSYTMTITEVQTSKTVFRASWPTIEGLLLEAKRTIEN